MCELSHKTGIMLPGCTSAAFVRLFVHSSGQILLPLTSPERLEQFDKTDTEYSLVSTDALIRF